LSLFCQINRLTYFFALFALFIQKKLISFFFFMHFDIFLFIII